MAGKDYQIFDKNIGVMDVTYSSAWSLGRLVAISDSPFNAALLRFRSLIWQESASNTRIAVNNISKTNALLSRATGAIGEVRSIRPATFTGPVSRLIHPSTDPVAPPLSDPEVAPVFAEAVVHSVDLHSSVDGGERIYSDFQLAAASNSDWELIHNWISNTLYLANIPGKLLLSISGPYYNIQSKTFLAHYLFPEPTHVQAEQIENVPANGLDKPAEALRFFHIDHTWLDCFLDGALSCANHLEPQYDTTRQRIKEVYNFYLRSNIHPLEGQTPPIPRSGFILRSSVVKAIPDLKIAVIACKWDHTKRLWIADPSHDPVVRFTRLDEFTVLCLLDCLPEDIFNITIAQPAHQQRFAMGASLKPNEQSIIAPNVEVRTLYTRAKSALEGAGDEGVWPPLDEAIQPTGQDKYYDSEIRCIKPAVIVKSINEALLLSNDLNSPKSYDNDIPDSCVLGLELNDYSCKFRTRGLISFC